MTLTDPTPTEHLIALREGILAKFNLEDVRTLVFDLSVSYDDLRGDTISAKVQALLEHLEKRGRVPDLLALLKQRRPKENWDSFLPAQPDAQSPYKGLQFFDEEDADLFFGREQLTAELVDHLRNYRFLAIVGASGSGKSSVVRAGVIPQVKSGAIAEDGLRSGTWKVHIITPTEHPLQTLAASLTHDSESVTAAITLADDLRQDSRSLDIYVSRLLEGQPSGHILLVVDQFEELFTQCDDLEERRLFVENLVTAVTSGREGRFFLVLTLRADFYAFAVQYEGLRPLLETQQKIVGGMNKEELRQAIEGPAQATGWQLQPGLVDTMLQAIGREPGALPLLSHALQETWERREGRVMTLAGYHAAGGVRRAIAQTADTVYARLTPEEQAIARNIFLRLTELGEGTEDTRRRASLAELMPQGEMETAVQEVIDLLARKRLVMLNEERSGGDVAQNYAEVAHEALIREWPALREWLDEDREGLRIHRQLTAVAKEWQAADEEPGYLYRGARLAQALEWASQHETQLNELEKRFLVGSETAVEQEVAEREAQRQRELEQAQQLVDAQTRRVKVIRQALGGILLLLFLAIGAAIFGFVQSGRAEQENLLAKAQLLAALSLRIYQRDNNSELATLLAVEASSITQKTNADWLINDALRVVLKNPYFNTTLSYHNDDVVAVAFSNDGRTMASGGDDGLVLLWNAEDLQAEPEILGAFEYGISSLAFSPDGKTLIAGDKAGVIHIWNIFAAGANLIEDLDFGYWSTHIAFGPEGRYFISGNGDGIVRLWDINNLNNEPIVLGEHPDGITSIAFSSDGSKVVTGGYNGRVMVWSSVGANGPIIEWLVYDEEEINSLAFSPLDPNILAGASSTWEVYLWSIESDVQTEIAIWKTENPYTLAFTPDGKQVVSGGADKLIRLWNVDDPNEDPIVVDGHQSDILSLAFSPNGNHLISGSRDDLARYWDMEEPIKTDTILSGYRALPVTYSPDGQYLAAGNYASIWIWDADNLKSEPLELGGQGGWARSIKFSPDGQMVATSSEDGRIRVWNLSNQLSYEQPTIFPPQEEEAIKATIYSIAFSLDGTKLFSSADNGQIYIWNLRDPNEIPYEINADSDDQVYSVALSPDGNILASGGRDGIVRIWEVTDFGLELVKELDGLNKYVWSVVFSPDGLNLAATNEDGIILLWDMSNLDAAPRRLIGHTYSVLGLAFSDDGRFLASAGSDRTTRLWDMEHLDINPLVFYGQEKSGFWSVTFSPKDNTLVSADSYDIWVWMSLDRLIETACQKLNRNFTWSEWQQYFSDQPYHQTCSNLPVHSSVPQQEQ